MLSALAFTSPLRMEEMLDRLRAGTKLGWQIGDSAWLGDYLRARIGPDGSLRLYAEGKVFVIEMRRGAVSEATRRMLLDEILPLLQAADIAPNSGFD